MIKIAVIGAGPSGMIAAGFAAKNGASVTIYEKNRYTGRKLLITGKGRCNLNNYCTIPEFMENVPTNPKFLYSAINEFSPHDTFSFFEQELGVPLKVERGRRVFPESDKSRDIRDALLRFLNENGVKIIYSAVESIKQNDKGGFSVKAGRQSGEFDKLIIATGGKSYPLTGSTGDGYAFAENFGHTIVTPTPSLVPLVTVEKWPREVMGLSLKNVTLEVVDLKKKVSVFKELGEALFTHFGISGPLVLSASSHMKNMESGRYAAYFDLKPALDEEVLDKRILSDFSANKNREFKNSLSALLPSALIPIVVKHSGIEACRKVCEIRREERRSLVLLLKHLPLNIAGFAPIDEAIITSGGINVREINPKTMESKIVPGIYFAGEIIDVDAYTGGYNLQIAFSTGRLAGINSSGE